MEVPSGLLEPTGVVGAVEWVECGASEPPNDATSLMEEAEALEVAPREADASAALLWH